MKCPKCLADFHLTWRLYLAAPFGKFPCPCCAVGLRGKHRWWYWPLMMLGICSLFVPVGYLVGMHYGWKFGIVAGLEAGLVSGIPFDKFLESRFSILGVQPCAAPNGGPATQPGSPGVSEGPPSAS